MAVVSAWDVAFGVFLVWLGDHTQSFGLVLGGYAVDVCGFLGFGWCYRRMFG